jgi:hypothetical protein
MYDLLPAVQFCLLEIEVILNMQFQALTSVR